MLYTNWSLVFGRLHPLVVHLPIGILFFTLLLQIIAHFRKKELSHIVISIGIVIAFLSALLSVLSGLLLSENGNYDSETVNLHKWVAISMTALLLVVWLMKRFAGSKARLWSNLLLSVCLVLTIIAGHAGGTLTHGEGYLSRFLPGSTKKSASTEKQGFNLPLDSVIVYRDIIQPILDKRCVGCHSSKNAKGGLVLSSIEGMLKGGLGGAAVVPGDPEKSLLLERVMMSSDRPKFMPTGNGIPLTPIEIHFIQYWIQQGAKTGETISQEKVSGGTRETIAAFLGMDHVGSFEIKLPLAKPADSVLVSTLRKQGLLIKPLTSTSNLLDLSFVSVSKKPLSEVNRLLADVSKLGEQVYWLNMSSCTIDAESIQYISTLSHLNRLDLRNCRLDDASISSLKKLQSLEWLNLSGNNLTDKSLGTIRALKSLKKLYVFGNAVSENELGNSSSEKDVEK